MTKDEIKELINNTELDIVQIMELIEQYVLDRKNKVIKIKNPGQNKMEMFKIISAYNDNVVPYYVQELGLNA